MTTAEVSGTESTPNEPIIRSEPLPKLEAASSGDESHPNNASSYHFFLLRPQSNSSKKVLIALESSSMLKEVLYNRTVLEFPTIYVLSTPPEQLPVDFLLEKDYLAQQGEEQDELKELLSEVGPQVIKNEPEAPIKPEDFDSESILKVLKKDLSAIM